MRKEDGHSLSTFFVVLMILILAGGTAYAESVKDEKIIGGKIDKVKVIYAVDGYMADSSGELKNFILGAVKIHKKGAPQDKWTKPQLYFEFDNKKTFADMGKVMFFKSNMHVKRFYSLATDYNYAKYNRNEYASKGLSEGYTPREFELDFIFDINGSIDIQKSSMGIVPKEYQAGSLNKKYQIPTGEYYKKGSKTEKVALIHDATGKITNIDEIGETVFKEENLTLSEVCFDYYSVLFPQPTPAATPTLSSTHRKETEPAPVATPLLIPPPKEKPKDPSAGEIDNPYKPTGLCSIYKIKNISHTVGLPDGEAFGLIERIEG